MPELLKLSDLQIRHADKMIAAGRGGELPDDASAAYTAQTGRPVPLPETPRPAPTPVVPFTAPAKDRCEVVSVQPGKQRETQDGPWCWLNKGSLRRIQESTGDDEGRTLRQERLPRPL